MIQYRTAPSIRRITRILLPILAALPIACGPPPSPPPAAERPAGSPPAGAPAAPLTPVQQVWSSRPRSWDRVLVGLTHLPNQPVLTAKPVGPGKLYELPSGRLLARVPAAAPVMLSPASNDKIHFATKGAAGTVTVLRLVASRGDLWLEGKRHTGSLLCWVTGERAACALDASVEDYLRGVLPGEVPAAWPLEAQKALAVAARTYVQASRGKHAADGFDLCDGTHCQMYLGHVPGAARSERAVRETRGLVALYDGKPIRAFYSADCGGRTANNEDVPFADNPPEPQPYLRSVPDTPYPGGLQYCARSPHHRWSRLLSSDQIAAALNTDPATAIGTLRGFQVAAMDASGRVKRVQVEGLLGTTVAAQPPGEASARHPVLLPATIPPGSAAPPPAEPSAPGAPPAEEQPVTRTLDGYAFRRAIGPRWLKSTRFTVTQLSPTLFRLTGEGYGHGVGLCQIGARGMALPPYRCTFRQILRHYYQGITIAPFHPSGSPP